MSALIKHGVVIQGIQNHAVSVIAAELEIPLMKNGLKTIIKNENKKNNSRKMDGSSTDYASSNEKIRR